METIGLVGENKKCGNVRMWKCENEEVDYCNK
jgi:hypothetical protein